MPTPEEVKAAPAGVHGPTDFRGKKVTVHWIANHHLDNEDLDPMFDWYQVTDESQVYGRIAVQKEGLVNFFLPGDSIRDGIPVNTMDKAISKMLL